MSVSMISNFTPEHIWDDHELIKAYDIAKTLGIRNTNRGKGSEIKNENEESNEMAGVPVFSEGDMEYFDDDEETVGHWEQGFPTDPNWVQEPIASASEDEFIETTSSGLPYPTNTSKSKIQKSSRKEKQVRFEEFGTTSFESEWRQNRGTGARNTNKEDVPDPNKQWNNSGMAQSQQFYNPTCYTTDWTQGLFLPPMPTAFSGQSFQKGSMQSLLMSWYMCGYHAGYFDAKQDLKRKSKEMK